MTFDWTLSVGNALTILGFACVVVATFARMYRKNASRLERLEACLHRHLGGDNDEPMVTRMKLMESRVGDLWRWFLERKP